MRARAVKSQGAWIKAISLRKRKNKIIYFFHYFFSLG